MSYRRIRDEVFDALCELPDSRRGWLRRKIPAELRVGEAQQVVLERHIRDGELSSLVPFATENFDTTRGDEFIWPLSDALVERGQLRELRRLWKGIIANRRRASGKLRADGDPTITPYEQNARAAAIRALKEYAAALRRLGEEEEAVRIEEDIGRFRAGQRRKRPRRIPDKRPMDEAVFWEVIEETGGDETGTAVHVERLVERLERFSLTSIRNFQKQLVAKIAAANLRELWAVAFIVRDGCGDDAFDYFRAWLVLQGRDRFEAAIAGPPSAADWIGDGDPQCESLLYAAELAYENRKDAPMKEVRRPAGELTGQEWTEEDLPDRFPGLWQRFRGDAPSA